MRGLLVRFIAVLTVLSFVLVSGGAAVGADDANATDLSVPSSLVEFKRSSPEAARSGDTVSIDWTVEDVPAFYVAFYFYDALGSRHQATYAGEPAYSGTATLVIDEALVAAGPMRLRNVLVQAGSTQVDYRAGGQFYKSPSGLQDPKTTSFDFEQLTVNVEGSTDLSVPSSLVEFKRSSPEAARSGDTVSIDWTVEDVPAFYVAFYFYDALGSRHQATYAGEPAYSGTATLVIDEALVPAGPMRLRNVLVQAGSTQVDYRAGGHFYKSPSGLQDPKTTSFDFEQLTVNVEGSTDLSVPSSLVEFKRSSPEAARSGDTVSIDWTVEDVPAFYVAFYFYDALGSRHQATYAGEPAYSGTATLVIDEALVAAGPMRLRNVLVQAGSTQVDYRAGGQFYKSPSGLQDPKTTSFDFEQSTVRVGGDVSPAAVVFKDEDGTVSDTYMIPTSDGVDYWIDNRIVPAGTYPGTGTVTVTAKARTDYVLAEGAAAEWTATFKATPLQVSPAAVTFADKDGTGEDTYTVPATDGVDYLVGDRIVPAGSYPGTGTVTVTAKARTDYVLAQGAAAEWTATFKATPLQVSPAAVTFADKDGTGEDTYTVPATDGVDYLVGDRIVPAGSYHGTGTVTVTAKARTDYVLAQGAAAEWTATFKATIASGRKVTDLNSDGKADLLTRDTSGVLWFYPGNGKGSFTTRTRIGSGWNAMNALA